MANNQSIEHFFTPKAAAVIGASNNKGTIGYVIFENMKKASIAKAYPVNPKYGKVQGVKAYHSISDVPGNISLAVIAVPAPFVPGTLEECMKKKIPAVIIVSAGFSEVGESKNTQAIKELIKKHPGTRVMGPNCVGVLNNFNRVDTTFFERNRMKEPKKGTLSFISQSGALGSMILDWVATQQFGINKFVSYGNAMDVDEADLLEYFGDDKGTKVITGYIEGAKEGRKFYSIAQKVSRKKPIIVIKGGKNEATTKAAASHTGSLAGSSKVYDAVFHQAGVIQAEDLLDLFSIAKLLEREPLPKGRRVQIITNGGGFGIVTADQVIDKGLMLATPSPATIKKLMDALPMAIISNPIDLLGDADASRYEKAIMACLEDKNIDIIMVLALFNLPPLEAKKLAILRKARKIATKPVVVLSIGSDYTENYLRIIEKAGFTTFNYPSVAAKALKAMSQYAQFRKLYK